MVSNSKIEQYVLLAKGLRGLALCDLINKATAEPGLHTFGELLSLPHVQEVGPLLAQNPPRCLLVFRN
jgi:COP9 signalosome complex subunit 7